MAANAEPKICPFTILVDTAETQPFTFQGLRADSDKANRPLYVKCRYSCLGRFPHSLGDYTIEGLGNQLAIERKSMEDAQSTVLGWESKQQRDKDLPGRRERFKKELQNLSRLNAAMVVVEATFGDCLRLMPEWGKKPAEHNRKIFFRSVLAWQQDYKVPWLFCDGRRLAEIAAFRFLQRFWDKQFGKKSEREK